MMSGNVVMASATSDAITKEVFISALNCLFIAISIAAVSTITFYKKNTLRIKKFLWMITLLLLLCVPLGIIETSGGYGGIFERKEFYIFDFPPMIEIL